MRIVGGQFRGTALAGLGKGDAGAHLRPTTDRVRETLFNVLAGGKFGDPIENAHVLDLFAGTGALGLEALSRGAKSAVFVDDGSKSRGLIRDNIARTRTGDVTQLIKRDATRLPANDGPMANLVFLDPPYGKALGEKALIAAVNGGWIAPQALIVWEENAPQHPPVGFTLLDHRRYGETTVTFLERDQ